MKNAGLLVVLGLVSLLLVSSSPGGSIQEVAPPAVIDDPDPANADKEHGGVLKADKPKPANEVGFVNRSYRQGTVTALTKKSITIQCPEWTGKKPVLGKDGVSRWQTVTIPREPPKKFAVSKILASGAVPDAPNDNRAGAFQIYRYRLTDVKVGDWVCIYYSLINGIDTCTYINIVKRPGGRVPALPEVVERLRLGPPPPQGWDAREPIRYHEGMNAYWDLVDKGIPYPERFGNRRRFPIAPMPREGIPKSLPANP